MLKITPEKVMQDIFHLPVYESVKIASAVGHDGKRFDVCAGLTHELVKQLKEYSLNEADTELQQSTRDYKRFGVGDYEKWYENGKMPFVLVAEPEGILAAITWFGPKPYPLADREEMNKKNTHTVAYRSYHPYRGKHLMSDFARFTLNTYLVKYPDILLWIETNSSEGMGMFNKIGFKETGEISPLGKTVMVYVK